MRTSLPLVAFVFACAGIAAAQDKITVPLSDPSQPATVIARLILGSIKLTAGNAGEVVVESQSRGRRVVRDNPPPGMHRLDAAVGGLNVEEDHNTVMIGSMRPDRNGDLVIQVPVNTSLRLRTAGGGSIDVSGIDGDLDVENINGTVTLTNVSGSIMAHTLNGSITATVDRVASGKPMSFTSLNGKVDVTLPADTKARLRLKNDSGQIYTDFDVKLEAGSRGGYGSINGGGPEYVFQTFNGSIYIHRK